MKCDSSVNHLHDKTTPDAEYVVYLGEDLDHDYYPSFRVRCCICRLNDSNWASDLEVGFEFKFWKLSEYATFRDEAKLIVEKWRSRIIDLSRMRHKVSLSLLTQ